MNKYQLQMYNDLMNLVSNSDVFYFQDFEVDGHTYRIFNYRLASYTDFMQPSALECRGHMFEIVGGDKCSSQYDSPIRLATLPMQKFFNLNEVSPDINVLAESLIKQGRLSRDVYNRAKKRSNC